MSGEWELPEGVEVKLQLVYMALDFDEKPKALERLRAAAELCRAGGRQDFASACEQMAAFLDDGTMPAATPSREFFDYLRKRLDITVEYSKPTPYVKSEAELQAEKRNAQVESEIRSLVKSGEIPAWILPAYLREEFPGSSLFYDHAYSDSKDLTQDFLTNSSVPGTLFDDILPLWHVGEHDDVGYSKSRKLFVEIDLEESGIESFAIEDYQAHILSSLEANLIDESEEQALLELARFFGYKFETFDELNEWLQN